LHSSKFSQFSCCYGKRYRNLWFFKIICWCDSWPIWVTSLGNGWSPTSSKYV